jgi:hypothetical protein
MDGSEYKNIRNVFEQREALALMGERHGWQRINNCLDQLLTLEQSDDGPLGERHGW